MAQAEVKVTDKQLFLFWSKNWGTTTSVRIQEFAAVFVKRFQSGEDGYPKYPAHILFRIIDHFIARKDDLSEPIEITTSDMATFTNRFGSLPTAVQLVAENFLDPHGHVHMWYHFSLPSHVIDRKLMTERNHAWLLRDSSSSPGDFVLVLRKAEGGKKEILIEHVKDKETGRMKYGTKTLSEEDNQYTTRALSPSGRSVSAAPTYNTGGGGGAGKQAVELRLFSMSLLEYLRTRTANFTPVCSQLYLGTHPDFGSEGETKSKKSDKDKDGDHMAPSQLSDDRNTGFKVQSDTVIEFSSYSDWAAERSEKHKAANNRYKNWQAAAQTQSTSSKDGKNAISLTKYVAGLQISGLSDKK